VLDLRLIREDPDGVRAALARRGGEAAGGLDGVIELDRRRRELLPELEGLRAEQNEANTRIRAAADAGEREREIEAMRGVAARAKALEQELLRRCPTCPTPPPLRAPRTSSCARSVR
jgi:seryl-tRNA synthetase